MPTRWIIAALFIAMCSDSNGAGRTPADSNVAYATVAAGGGSATVTEAVYCRTLFDLGEAGYVAWPALVSGLFAIVVGAAVARFTRSSGLRRWWVLVFALVWTIADVQASFVPFLTLRRALARKDYSVVQGVITEYHALQERQTGDESFVVNSRRFSFSEFDLAPGFKLTRRRGGSLDVGTYVRVAYRGDTILRLETCVANPEWVEPR